MTEEFMIGVLNTSVVTGLSIVAAGIILRVSWKSYSAKCRKRYGFFWHSVYSFRFICFTFREHTLRKFPMWCCRNLKAGLQMERESRR